ncbi:MAG TPA: hypothetical protein VG123_15720 [Streptosporangiaceae bacterium]|nr:hypothetical protein [Streptosporangiaceae bacterium]
MSDQENPAQPQRGSGRCGDVLDWTRDGWWFRAWSGLCAVAV